MYVHTDISCVPMDTYFYHSWPFTIFKVMTFTYSHALIWSMCDQEIMTFVIFEVAVHVYRKCVVDLHVWKMEGRMCEGLVAAALQCSKRKFLLSLKGLFGRIDMHIIILISFPLDLWESLLPFLTDFKTSPLTAPLKQGAAVVENYNQTHQKRLLSLPPWLRFLTGFSSVGYKGIAGILPPWKNK